MSNEPLIAALNRGGMAMLGVVVLIAAVAGLVYLAWDRRRSDGEHASDRSPEA